MSEAAQTRPSDSLLYSDQLFRVLGGDAMQILRCGICMEFFDVPIVLPCGHTFCLHCLTEMCKHASRNCVLSPLKDLRIGCPNCRVLIYASPILERNVTCNFIIQSLIECLRAREGCRKQSVAVNTEEVRMGNKIRAVSDVEIERVLNAVDRVTEALGKHSVVDNAYFEIDEIRSQYLSEQEEEDYCQHQSRSRTGSVPPCSSHSRRHQPPARYHQQQTLPCSKPTGWDPPHIKTMTPTTSFHYQHQQQPQPGFRPNLKFAALKHPPPPFPPRAHQQQQPKPQTQQQPLPPTQQQPPPPTQQQPLPPTQQKPLPPQPSTQQQSLPPTQQQPLPPQPPTPQQPPVWPGMPKINKMATILQRCPEAGRFPGGSSGQCEQASGHPPRLDNDPAVMSYSYKASINAVVGK